MFEYAQSVFQHPNYNGELNQLYNLRKLKYSISEKESQILFSLLDSGICKGLYRYDQICDRSTKRGYEAILSKIEAEIAMVREHNKQILKHPFKRLFPSLFTMKVGKKVKVAYEFIKYHHFNYMALEYPDLAFNRCFGIQDGWKRYETYPKQFTATNKKSSFKEFSASNLKSYISSKRGLLFRHPLISELYDEFTGKLDYVDRRLNELHIIRDKKAIRTNIKRACEKKYADLGGSPTTPFIKRLASFLGFAHKERKPIRNLFIQEVRTKINRGSEDSQQQAKAMVNFTKGLCTSNKAADYSVSEAFRMKPAYKHFVLADAPEKMPGDLNAQKFMPKPNITVH